jgi:cobalt-zinc-cadmium efflux system outer membrane protein
MPAAARSLGCLVCFVLILSSCAFGQDPPVILGDLLTKALQNSPEIKAAEAKAAAMAQKVPMEGSLMDPMLSVGYQNEGLKKYNYGESPDAQWMFSLAQTYPWPGKRTLQEEAATLDAEAEKASAEMVRREVIVKVTQAYYDLVLITKELDLIRARRPLIEQIEDIALKRYAAGTLSQDEVLMAQAEKYMLQEAEEMAQGRRESAEAMIRQTVGSMDSAPLGRPVETLPTVFAYTQDELIDRANRESPEIRMREKLMLASVQRFERSKKDAWPDVTVMGKYSSRGGGLADMAELTFSVPLPLYYKNRQGAGISEASWVNASTQKELEASRFKAASEIRDNLAMIHATERIMQLYRNALIPKSRQVIDAALASFSSGRLEASMALAKLKAPFDYELTAWQQQVLREKAIARIKALTGDLEAQR